MLDLSWMKQNPGAAILIVGVTIFAAYSLFSGETVNGLLGLILQHLYIEGAKEDIRHGR
jgi:hypothetical protein